MRKLLPLLLTNLAFVARARETATSADPAFQQVEARVSGISNKFLLCAMLVCVLVVHTHAQTAATLTVFGAVTTPLELKMQDLAVMKQVSLEVKDRDGQEHEFKGVALIEILERAGVTTGSKLRGENLAKYALITAADGYEVLYSLAEIDPEFTNQVVLLAIEKDGQPLPPGEGPLRIIIPGDKRPARWTREVRSIKIAFAKK